MVRRKDGTARSTGAFQHRAQFVMRAASNSGRVIGSSGPGARAYSVEPADTFGPRVLKVYTSRTSKSETRNYAL